MIKSPLSLVTCCLAFIFASSLQPNRQIDAQTNCPVLESPITGADPNRSMNAWPIGAQVTVNIIHNNPINGQSMTFSEAEIQAIQEAFGSWQVQCSGVSFFQFMVGNQNCTTCFDTTGNYVSVSKTLLSPSSDGSPRLGNTSLASDGTALHHAIMSIDARVTNAVAFKKTVVHEVGHTFGLRHCVVIIGGGVCGSAMDNASAYNDTGPGFTAPTACDLAAAKQAGNYCARYKCSNGSCVRDDANGTFNSPNCNNSCGGGGGGGGGCELFDGDGDGWDLCEDCDDSFYDPSNECDQGEGCPCIRDSDCDLCNEGYCDIGLHECFAYTPILIDINGNGYRMTDAANGIVFDFKASGSRDSLSWTAAGSDDAWLVLDRNGNGVIDDGAELFGSATPQGIHPGVSLNGFLALAHYDRPSAGGNSDDLIDSHDAIFPSLRLWQDLNHNGISESTELHMLPELGVFSIRLDYRESRRTDQYGNQFRYRAKVFDAHGAQVGRWAWDVILTKLHP